VTPKKKDKLQVEFKPKKVNLQEKMTLPKVNNLQEKHTAAACEGGEMDHAKRITDTETSNFSAIPENDGVESDSGGGLNGTDQQINHLQRLLTESRHANKQLTMQVTRFKEQVK